MILAPPPLQRVGAATDPAIGTSDRVVSVDGLVKTFPQRRGWSQVLRAPFRAASRVTVIDRVRFDVGASELFGLLGANGAGKTTLFRMLAAQLAPDAGTATIVGADVVRQPRLVRSVIAPVTTDERSLNWRLTATENLELFAALYGVRGAASTRRIGDVLQTVGLHDAGTKMVGTFSSGMKQRLLIARALLGRPRVLLLDEPTRSLDPISARHFRAFLRTEIVGQRRCTVLLATHNAEEAFDLCDRVAVLERGRLLALDAPRRLMARLSDDRYHLDLRERQGPAAMALLTSWSADARFVEGDAPPGWHRLELRIPQGADGAADLLGRLARAGIDVSRFQRIDATLAELLERVRERGGNGAHA